MKYSRRLLLLTILSASVFPGCNLAERFDQWQLRPKNQMPPPPPITYSQYHLDGWDWDRVARVVVLPVRNETKYSKADEEFQTALTSELQRLGRFEVVAAPTDDHARLATAVHLGGRFDETVMLDLTRRTAADVVVHATLTQYSPYPRPRLGVVIQAIAPTEAKVIASVDGLWDTTDGGIAEEMRSYYRQRPKPYLPYIRNYAIVADDNFAADLAMDSPALFQRYIANIVAKVLTNTENATIISVSRGEASSGTSCEPCQPQRRSLLHRFK